LSHHADAGRKVDLAAARKRVGGVDRLQDSRGIVCDRIALRPVVANVDECTGKGFALRPDTARVLALTGGIYEVERRHRPGGLHQSGRAVGTASQTGHEYQCQEAETSKVARNRSTNHD